jgi:hypothetical protein
LGSARQIYASNRGHDLTPRRRGEVRTPIAFSNNGHIPTSSGGRKITKNERVTAAGGWQWRITIMRGGQQISVIFSG